MRFTNPPKEPKPPKPPAAPKLPLRRKAAARTGSPATDKFTRLWEKSLKKK